MLNCFRLYSMTWLVVIFLYDLGWSSYCQPLHIYLRLFIYFSIILTFYLGFVFDKRLRFRKLEKELNIGNLGTLLIVGIQLLEYVYCQQVPLLSIIMTGADYTDFEGIPTLHVIVYTIASFYAQYLFYGFLNDRKWRYLINYVLIVFVVYGLQFMRGGLIICLGISFLLWLSSVKLTFKQMLGASVVVLLALYCFGGAGNVRSGFSWNDSSAFFRFGGINEKYPSWLPSQFAWTYSYIVGCLATLNHNVLIHFTVPDKMGFVQSIVPDFLARRIWSDFEISHAHLIWKGFTTTTGYFHAYYYGGMLGIYLMFFILLGIAFFFTLGKVVKPQFRIIAYANLCVIMSLYFFTNAIAVSAIGFTLVYPLAFSAMLHGSKYKFKIIDLPQLNKLKKNKKVLIRFTL